MLLSARYDTKSQKYVIAEHIHWVETMGKCWGCGAEDVPLDLVRSQDGWYCGVCRARIKAEHAKQEYYEEQKRKLEER